MTSLYGSEIAGLVSNPERDVTEYFPGATYAHLAGLFVPRDRRHQQQNPCVLSTKIRCGGNGLSLLRAPSPRTRGEGWDEGASKLPDAAMIRSSDR
jgi:hypothetical protein